MGKLIYLALTSLDGFIEDEEGKFDWAEPEEEVLCIRQRAGAWGTDALDLYVVSGAHESWRRLAWAWGEESPGPGKVRLPPFPAKLKGEPYYRFHRFGLESKPVDIVRRLSDRAVLLEEACTLGKSRLEAFPGTECGRRPRLRRFAGRTQMPYPWAATACRRSWFTDSRERAAGTTTRYSSCWSRSARTEGVRRAC
jgi:hypothetical protein